MNTKGKKLKRKMDSIKGISTKESELTRTFVVSCSSDYKGNDPYDKAAASILNNYSWEFTFGKGNSFGTYRLLDKVGNLVPENSITDNKVANLLYSFSSYFCLNGISNFYNPKLAKESLLNFFRPIGMSGASISDLFSRMISI